MEREISDSKNGSAYPFVTVCTAFVGADDPAAHLAVRTMRAAEVVGPYKESASFY
jgi:hypothetical protein